jgi:hypothetical protein
MWRLLGVISGTRLFGTIPVFVAGRLGSFFSFAITVQMGSLYDRTGS